MKNYKQKFYPLMGNFGNGKYNYGYIPDPPINECEGDFEENKCNGCSEYEECKKYYQE